MSVRITNHGHRKQPKILSPMPLPQKQAFIGAVDQPHPSRNIEPDIFIDAPRAAILR